MRKRVDLGVIADKVGVSKTTVHYALHQPERLGAETLQKVLAAVEELGYRPNLLARSLRTQRSFTLGVVTTSLGNYFDKVFQGMEEVSLDSGYTIFIGCTRSDTAREREVVEGFLERAVEGLVIVPSESEENAAFYQALAEERVPFVFAEHGVPGVNADSVGTDDALGGKIATEHLIRHGRKKVAFVPPPGASREFNWVRRRLEGCNAALAAAGLEPAHEVIIEADQSERHDQHGYNVASHCLHDGSDCDGVFAANDELAWGVLRSLTDAGRQPGQDFGVIGFDDLDPSAYLRVPLTSLRHPMGAIGHEAFRLLLRRIEDGAELAVQRTLLDPTLVVRKSCGE